MYEAVKYHHNGKRQILTLTKWQLVGFIFSELMLFWFSAFTVIVMTKILTIMSQFGFWFIVALITWFLVFVGSAFVMVEPVRRLASIRKID